jgi:PAS domain S-box-containing protein
MLCISSADGYFKKLNPAFSEILGWSMDELLSHPYLFFVHPDDVEATQHEVERQVAAGETVYHFENRYRRKAGDYRTLAWRSVPQPGGFMYAVARDVTELRAQEKELKEKNADLEQFSHAVAHDLRGPLRAIGGYANLLDSDIGDVIPAESRADLLRIQASVVKMNELTDGLLRFSRAGIQVLDCEDVEMEKLVNEVIADIREEYPDRKLNFSIGNMPEVFADPDMMKIVLNNLLLNAVKYSRLREQSEIEVGYDPAIQPEAFYVKDNGAGFDMQYVDRLFEVFERIHPVSSYEGHGIGLATVKRILQRHGGTIWAIGEPDKGATFYFTV